MGGTSVSSDAMMTGVSGASTSSIVLEFFYLKTDTVDLGACFL